MTIYISPTASATTTTSAGNANVFVFEGVHAINSLFIENNSQNEDFF